MVPRRVLAMIVIALGLSGAFLAYGRLTSPHQMVIPFHTLPATGATGQSEPANLVINDNETWMKVWNQSYLNIPTYSYCIQNPCEQAPFVNFTTRTLIDVFMGEQPGPLYRIKITQIVESGSSMTVHVLWTKAGNCIEVAEDTWPSYPVDIPKTQDRITFTTETVVMQCCTQPSLLGGYPCLQAPLRPSPSER
jgi:hypothetical protein